MEQVEAIYGPPTVISSHSCISLPSKDYGGAFVWDKATITAVKRTKGYGVGEAQKESLFPIKLRSAVLFTGLGMWGLKVKTPAVFSSTRVALLETEA
jgi:hypothetical protein